MCSGFCVCLPVVAVAVMNGERDRNVKHFNRAVTTFSFVSDLPAKNHCQNAPPIPATSDLIVAAFSPEFQVGLSGDASTAGSLLMKTP